MDTTKPPDMGFGVRVLFVLLGGAKAIFDLYARNEKYYFDDFVSFNNTVPLTLNTTAIEHVLTIFILFICSIINWYVL